MRPEPRPPLRFCGKSKGGTPLRERLRELGWDSLSSLLSTPLDEGFKDGAFMERFNGASSAEVGVPDPHGSIDTLALSSRQAALLGTPFDNREFPEPTVEMETLGSDLSR